MFIPFVIDDSYKLRFAFGFIDTVNVPEGGEGDANRYHCCLCLRDSSFIYRP